MPIYSVLSKQSNLPAKESQRLGIKEWFLEMPRTIHEFFDVFDCISDSDRTRVRRFGRLRTDPFQTFVIIPRLLSDAFHGDVFL